MVAIEHTRNTVKPEPVESKSLQPIANVAKEKTLHLVFAVIETSRIPCGMFAFLTGVEVVTCCAIKVTQALVDIFNSMAMHQVHNNQQPHAVRCIYKCFEFFWSSETTGDSEKVAHVVPKTRIIGMLHHRHQLNGVVA